MKIAFSDKISRNTDLIVRFVSRNQMNYITNKTINRAIKNIGFEPTNNSSLFVASERILLFGIDPKSFDIKKIGRQIGIQIIGLKFNNITIDIKIDKKDLFELIRIISMILYEFSHYKTIEKTETKYLTIIVEDPNEFESSFLNTRHLIEAHAIARNLINEPSNILTTTCFIQKIKSLINFETNVNTKIEILDSNDLFNIGANLILSVGKGSINPPFIASISYHGNHASKNIDIALIGKGICFDAGGICLKSCYELNEMKADMAGAATVLAALNYAIKSKLQLNIVTLIGLAENLPNGNCIRPGDVIKSLSGYTVEILNTDAEGRLVLADCISYAINHFSPQLIIDVATLTGAVEIALGTSFAGLFTNNEILAKNLISAGEESGDRLWRLPLGKEYRTLCNSSIADICNIGNSNGKYVKSGGASCAAEFIQFFVGKTAWAHIDIAATAYDKNGATGYGIALLATFLNNLQSIKIT